MNIVTCTDYGKLKAAYSPTNERGVLILKGKVSEQLNQQIQKELFSAYIYLEISNYYKEEGLDGFANWFDIQAREELSHARLFGTYMQNNDWHITLLPVDAPGKQYDGLAQPLEAALRHEQYVTASIHAIYEAALAEKDYRTIEFLNWFIKEQGEEEKNAGDLIKKFKLFGGDAKGLYQLDQELAGRIYSEPDLVLD